MQWAGPITTLALYHAAMLLTDDEIKARLEAGFPPHTCTVTRCVQRLGRLLRHREALGQATSTATAEVK